MKRTKRDLKLEFTSRYLSIAEADAIRATVAAMRPKIHLVLSNWRWLECRGIREEAAAKVIEALDALPGLSFKEL